MIDYKEFLIAVFVILFVFFLSIAILVVPFIYFEGAAKSNWIRETKNIEIPWHEAAFLDIEINSVDIERETND